MTHLTTFTFKDLSEDDDACIVVRYGEESVALTLSLIRNGDIQVVMPKQVLSRLIDALIDAKSKI
jgi:hypothetical protein